MFRMQKANLPEDPVYPVDLKALGFFINNVGQFRLVAFPERNYSYCYSNDERHNEVRREALQICQQNEVLPRLSALGIEKLYLPQLANTKLADEASVPILAPPAEILKTRKRVIVLVNDTLQDLGILAYRRLQRECGVNGGSVVNFAKEVVKRCSVGKDKPDIFKDGAGVADNETPGLVVMNCGQLLYSYKNERVMTVRSWNTMKRKSACHESVQICPENHVEDNRDAKEHIKFVLDKVINNKDFVSEHAEIYVIAIENGAENVLDILNNDVEKYGSRITAISLINAFVKGPQVTNPKLKAFLHQRARQWNVFSGSNNPKECIGIPSHYYQEVEVLDSSVKDQSNTLYETAIQSKTINWLETVPTGVLSTMSNLLSQLTFAVHPRDQPSFEAADDRDEMEPICPTFADAENPQGAGECVFTCPEVQRCILDFFEEVARNPSDFRNPLFKVTIPEFDRWGLPDANEESKLGSESDDAAYQPLQPAEMSPAQAELDEKKAELENMKAALHNTPAHKPELQPGREGLEKRIAKMEKEVHDLSKQALATGGLKAGQAEDLRDNWTPVGTGPKIPFMGVMVDSDMVKGAGMPSLAEEELKALEEEAEERT